MVSVSATRTPKDRRFNLQNNNSACASLSLVHFLASTQHEIALIFVQCVVLGNIHTPTEDVFDLPPPPPNGIPGGVCQIPPTFWNFQLGLAPPEKTVSVKNAVAQHYYVKDDCPLYYAG